MRRSAKIYMSNEVGNDSGLRCRSRSCSRDSLQDFYSPSPAEDRHAQTKVSGSLSTPGYGLKLHARNHHDCDSGFLEDSTASGDFKTTTIISGWRAFQDLKCRWKKYHKASLYDTSPVRIHSMKLNDLIPIIVMITTLASAIFTVFMLTNSLNKVQRNRNGKYDSIQYGHEKHMENLQIPHPILDENGVALGGKKASIQYAYNMRHGIAEKQPKQEDMGLTDEEIINRLTFKVANDAMQHYEQKLVPGQKVEKSGKKERLLKKIGEFGHLGNLAVQPLDL